MATPKVIYATIIVCCVAALAYLQGRCSQCERQDTASCSAYRDLAKQNRIKIRRSETKARWLIVVTSDGCGPCQELKKEVQNLQKEGYLVNIIDRKQWDRTEVNLVPALFYFRGGEIIYTEVGFKTAEHIKKKLEKP